MHSVAFPLIAVVLLLAGAVAASPGSESAPADSAITSWSQPDSVAVRPEVVVYYFHRTSRCHDCLTIEAYLDEALRTHFAPALDAGRLLWLPTNIEDPVHAHFRKDFSLEYNSAILVRLDAGQPASWTNLEEVWDLLEEKEAFVSYVREQVGAALDAAEEQRPRSIHVDK